MTVFLLTFLLGLLMLVGGAYYLVEGGANLAYVLRVPAVVVGLTIVAFGTSAPELTVSVTAALNASTDMAMSNVNGSNIANLLFVLGLAAVVAPLTVPRSLLRRDAPVCIAMQIGVLALSADQTFGRIDGLLVVLAGVAYNAWLFYDVRKGREELSEEVEKGGTVPLNVLKLVGGLGVLVLGADLFVDGAVEVARTLQMSDRLIGLTVVALGTSAPEAATAVVAARKGEVDVAVGGSVGSNILNIAMVLGFTAMIAPIDLSAGGFLRDMGVAVLAALMLVPLVRVGTITREIGAAMMAVYLLYMGYGVWAG